MSQDIGKSVCGDHVVVGAGGSWNTVLFNSFAERGGRDGAAGNAAMRGD
ncbi:hypothetical protein [Mycobacterium haemophilum]|nr:hypothetical protein [Mycobacterium haemophilum]MCV7339717.1 hypothetical protein [Mycobacterium haemophilum DSM 44634]